VLALLAFALQEVETKYTSGIIQAQRYLPHVVKFGHLKTLDPDYLAPKQSSKMAEGSDDFACSYACVSNFVSTWVIPIDCACACA